MTEALTPSVSGPAAMPGFNVYSLAATQHPQIWAPFLLLCQGGCLALHQNAD